METFRYKDHESLSRPLFDKRYLTFKRRFSAFQTDACRKRRLDCLHFYTLPSLAWIMALKHTEAELDLVTDPDMYLMVENSIRGGIAVISKRHSRARNLYVEEGYDESQPTLCLTYLDSNNLNGWLRSKPTLSYRRLPVFVTTRNRQIRYKISKCHSTRLLNRLHFGM